MKVLPSVPADPASPVPVSPTGPLAWSTRAILSAALRHVRLLLFCFPAFLPSGCGILGPDEGPAREPKEGDTTVLFIGSSYLAFNNVPDRVRDLARESGHRVFMRYHLALGYNWEIEKTLARGLREVAGSTVLDSLGLWNIDF